MSDPLFDSLTKGVSGFLEAHGLSDLLLSEIGVFIQQTISEFTELRIVLTGTGYSLSG